MGSWHADKSREVQADIETALISNSALCIIQLWLIYIYFPMEEIEYT